MTAVQIEVAETCSCAIGLFETDDTHRRDRTWDNPVLPEGESDRRRVVQVEVDAHVRLANPPDSIESAGMLGLLV